MRAWRAGPDVAASASTTFCSGNCVQTACFLHIPCIEAAQRQTRARKAVLHPAFQRHTSRSCACSIPAILCLCFKSQQQALCLKSRPASRVLPGTKLSGADFTLALTALVVVCMPLSSDGFLQDQLASSSQQP